MLWIGLAVAVIAVFSYANTFANGFALDDVRAIVENPLIRDLGNTAQLFRTNYWGAGLEPGVSGLDPGLYRPLTVLTYALSYQVWGLDPTAYHVVNVLLHAVTSVLVLVIAFDLIGSAMPAFGAAAVFAVHPIHADAVASVVGRAEVLATFFFLLAFWVARRSRTGFAETTAKSGWGLNPFASAAVVAALYFLAVLAKESAVTLPAVIALDDWFHREDLRRSHSGVTRAALFRYVPIVVVLIAYLALRAQAVGGQHGVWPGFTGVTLAERLFTASRVLFEYLMLFAFPRTLLADYWTTDVPIARSLFEPLVMVSIATWIGIGALFATKLRKDRLVQLSAAWFFVAILPVSNLFFAIGVAKAERILYLPSVGLCLVVGWALLRLSRLTIQSWIPATAVTIVLLALALRTLRRNRDWKDNLTLALATLEVSPRSPVMNSMAASEYAARGDLERAIRFSEAVVRETPAIAQGHLQLAKVYLDRGMLMQSAAEYTKALRLDPNNLEAHNNLGLAYSRMGRMDSTLVHLQASQRINPNSVEPRINLGMAYSALGRLPEAEAELIAALRLNPTSAEAHINLGAVYLKQNRLDDAASQFKAAVDINPRNPEAHNNLGYVYMLKGMLSDAVDQFRTALTLRPGYGNAAANLDRALKQQRTSR
jgi:tetratricopeptide (TPR) repeat protein